MSTGHWFPILHRSMFPVVGTLLPVPTCLLLRMVTRLKFPLNELLQPGFNFYFLNLFDCEIKDYFLNSYAGGRFL